MVTAAVQKRMREFEQALQKHVAPLSLAQGASTFKTLETHETSAQARHAELADLNLRIYEQVAGADTVADRLAAIERRALARDTQHDAEVRKGHKELSEQIDMGHEEQRAHWQDLVKRSEAQLNHIRGVGVQVVAVGESVEQGRRENSEQFAGLHVKIDQTPSAVARQVLAGVRALLEPQVGSV